MLGSHLRQRLVTLNVSLGQIPLKAFQALFNARWTKSQISWAIAYAYTIYVALSAIPPFKDNSIFSVTAASGLLVLLYFFHSYANLNLKTASKFFIIAATISFIWEFIGVTTGIPFGQYSYTTSLSPSLLSVPLFIPLLWFGLDNVIGDLASGSPWLALASFIIFTIATLIIFLVNGDRWRKLLGINAPTKSVS